MATNKEIVAKINEAFTNGDVEAFLTHCTEDIQWLMIGGEVTQGKKTIRESMAGMSPADAPKFTVDSLFGEGDLVACDGDMKMKTQEGRDWEGRYCDIYRFENGKVKELKSYVIEGQATKPKK